MKVVKAIAQNPKVKSALASFQQEVGRVVDLAIAVQQIPAPTFAEKKRAEFVFQQFQRIGLDDVHIDELNNVYGRLEGTGADRPVIVSAHTDTVFPVSTDLTVRYDNGHLHRSSLIYGPGLADNSTGVAGLLLLGQSLKQFELLPSADIWLVANVGEEGLGNLNGMRAVVERFGETAGYVVVEGGSFGHIFHRAVGVRRYRLEVHAPGGHSWGDFGSPSAVHVLSQIVAAMDELPLPEEPKTTYNVGVIEGGTTVNTIAAEASCQIDLRSISEPHLQRLVEALEALVREHDDREGVHLDLTEIGSRPSGAVPRDSALVTWAADALRQVGYRAISFMAGSTDANVPLSMGYPAVCIGLATSGNTHRLDEFLDPTHLPAGLGQLLLLTLAASGFRPDS
ncbi:MAG: M20/M25/M40 family metallo-hydrolase [Candidatus Promineifilaceae bacterium]|nr:M20/M25/M40 family metallo-hydrolase [Candidatus Promineifilaceae bacterium]